MATMPRTARLAVLGLALGSAAAALVAVDRVAGRVVDPRFTPLAGPPETRTMLVRSEFRVPVRTNAAGFRGAELPGAKPPGTFRIVVLGDSFTWGFGVRERQAYPARLARLLSRRTGGAPRVEVVNLGLPGAGPLDYLHHLDHTAVALEPDLIVVGLFANDVNDLYQVRRFGTRSPLYALAALQAGDGTRPWWKRAAERATPNLYAMASRAASRLQAGPRAARADVSPVPSVPARAAVDPEAMASALGERYGRREAVAARYRALPADDRALLDPVLAGAPLGEDMRPLLLLGALVDPDAERDSLLLRSDDRRAAWEETRDVLARIVRHARRAGARTVVAVLPASEQVNRARWRVLGAAGYRLDPAMLAEAPLADGVRAVAASEGATAVDLVEAFRRRRDADLYFHADEHWTARGQAYAAARLAAALLPEVR